MKKEIENAIREGINESELNGYTWKITADGLEWSYGETFTFIEEEVNMEDQYPVIGLIVKAEQSQMVMTRMLIGDYWFCDGDFARAYRLATKATIRRANSTY